MNPVHPAFAILVFATAAVTGWGLLRLFGLRQETGRVTALDGLRGYLALGVFAHHGAIWYFYLRGEPWELTLPNFYVLLGHGGVSFFFMVSAFLFTTRVLDADRKPIDWTRLYVSRLLRLVPLYWFAMLILFSIVAAESGFSRNVSWMSLASSTLNWLSFTVAGQTDINALPGTKLIIAGVTWSLPYEWMLYATLPLMAVGLRRAVPIWTVAAALLALAVLITAGHPGIGNSVVFLGGIIAAVFVRMPRWRMLAQGRIAGGVAALSILLAYTAFSKVHGPALVPLTIAFTIIASGNTLFGVLANPVSRLLGELSYSLYLLHGLLLFIIFRWVLPIDQAAGLTPVAHWAVVAALAPVLVLVSFITFHTIESPAMGAVSRVTTLLRTGRFRRPAVIPPI